MCLLKPCLKTAPASLVIYFFGKWGQNTSFFVFQTILFLFFPADWHLIILLLQWTESIRLSWKQNVAFFLKKSNSFFLYVYRDTLGRKYPLCLAHGGGCDTISQASAYTMWCKIILSTRQTQSLQPCRFKDESYFPFSELHLHLLWFLGLEPDLRQRELMPRACEASAHQKDAVVLNWMVRVSKYCQAKLSSVETQCANWEETADA